MVKSIGIPSDEARKAVLALVAHDGKKDDLLRLARRYRSTLVRLHLLATSHTGGLLSDELNLPVEAMRSGPEGGDIQIGARIVAGDVDAVVFLRDPLTGSSTCGHVRRAQSIGFAPFNSSAVFKDDVESYSTVEPAIDLAASSPLAFARQASGLY